MTAAHTGLSTNDIWDIVFLCWIFGGGALAAAGEWARRARKHRRRAAEVRHRRRLELEYARSGLTPPGKKEKASPVNAAEDDDEVPAAITAAPPGTRPVLPVPGKCRHERIIPAITGDGTVQRWVCANWPRCAAEFPADTALYEAGGDSPPGT
jgi:hypothetical protein